MADRTRSVARALRRAGAAAFGALAAGTMALVVALLAGAAERAEVDPSVSTSVGPPVGADLEALFGTAGRADVLALGPWPPANTADARNPASGRPEGVALGEALFHSTRLADAGGVRCASCHEPWRGFTDGRPRALGMAPGARNTPSLLNVATHRRFGWDGATDDLARQSLRPLSDPREMPARPAHIVDLLRGDAELGARFGRVFGPVSAADDDTLLRETGLALAAYVETLTSARTPFDDWRDAIAAGRSPGAAALPPAALRGLRLFVGHGGCVACHSGPTLGDDAFHVSLVRSAGPDGRADTGRPGPLPNAFRTPGLREVGATAPYMHDGSVATLCDAVRPHALGPDGVAPPSLDGADRRDLVAFLATLTASRAPGGDAGVPACAPR